jgi:hypothetical protein
MTVKPSRRSPLPGIVLALAGGGLTGAVMAANSGPTPALEALAWKLGLALAPLLLGVGLVALMTGLWLIWRARRPG